MATQNGLGPGLSGQESNVFGHYFQSGAGNWQPLLNESSSLFRAIVSDDSAAVESALTSDSGKLNNFVLLLQWRGSNDFKLQAKPDVAVKHRTLLMLAAYHGSTNVVSLLLSKGADAKVTSPDGLTALQVKQT